MKKGFITKMILSMMMVFTLLGGTMSYASAKRGYKSLNPLGNVGHKYHVNGWTFWFTGNDDNGHYTLKGRKKKNKFSMKLVGQAYTNGKTMYVSYATSTIDSATGPVCDGFSVIHLSPFKTVFKTTVKDDSVNLQTYYLTKKYAMVLGARNSNGWDSYLYKYDIHKKTLKKVATTREDFFLYKKHIYGNKLVGSNTHYYRYNIDGSHKKRISENTFYQAQEHDQFS